MKSNKPAFTGQRKQSTQKIEEQARKSMKDNLPLIGIKQTHKERFNRSTTPDETQTKVSTRKFSKDSFLRIEN